MAVIITGVFPSRNQAEATVRELRDRGFAASDIGLVIRGALAQTASAATPSGANAFTGVSNQRSASLQGVGDVFMAGTISDCAARQSPASGQISLTDVLIWMGIEQYHAAWHDQQVRQGYNLVTVRTENRADEAASIMDQFGSIEVPGRSRIPAQALDALPATSQGQAGVSPVSPVSPLSQVQAGYDVYTSDGHRVGTVQEATTQCVHVLCCSNMFVPPSRVERVTNDSIVINVREDQLESFDWSTCQPAHRAQYQSGGPGYSGLPPQEHEPGVRIPIETEGE